MIYATGAQTDKSLGIPGEDLPGSWAATEFVAWYNGHPDYRDLEFDLSARRAVVIGNGNVAADVTRILTLSPTSSSAPTSPTTRSRRCARAASRRSSCSAGAVRPRRPSRAPSCASSGTSTASTCASIPDEVELDPARAQWLAEEGTFTARKNVELLREFAARPRGRTTPPADRAALPALAGRDPRRRPGRGDRRPAATRSCAPTTDRCARGRRTRPVETIECGLVLRSVGYRAVPLPDVPFDERSFVLPNERGRVLDRDGEPLPGVYAVGWIKRGPTGILGTNKRDAEETVGLPGRGPRRGRASEPPAARERIDALLAERKPEALGRGANLGRLCRGCMGSTSTRRARLVARPIPRPALSRWY